MQCAQRGVNVLLLAVVHSYVYAMHVQTYERTKKP